MCLSNEFISQLNCLGCTAVYNVLDNFDVNNTGVFFVADQKLLAVLGCSNNCLRTHLNHLRQRGIINYKRGVRRGSATEYRLLSKIDPKRVRVQNLMANLGVRVQNLNAKIEPHYDHDMNDHDDFKDEKSKMIDVLRSMGVNGDSRRWVEALGINRMRELIEIAVGRATTSPGGYLRTLVDQEMIGGSIPQAEPFVALPVIDVKPGMIATHRRTGHQFKVKYAVAHRVVLEELDKSGNFGIDEADLKEYDFE